MIATVAPGAASCGRKVKVAAIKFVAPAATVALARAGLKARPSTTTMLIVE